MRSDDAIGLVDGKLAHAECSLVRWLHPDQAPLIEELFRVLLPL
ncbi:MAG TPA: hypothetical protein VGF47_05810 [Solirubrobacteraceae bacterium]